MYRPRVNKRKQLYLYKGLLLLIILSMVDSPQNEGVVAIIVSYELLLYYLLLTSYEY